MTERLGLLLLAVDSLSHTRGEAVQAQTESRGRRMNQMDCFLAATARVHQLIMVTRNTKHFSAVGCEYSIHGPHDKDAEGFSISREHGKWQCYDTAP